jgi:putative glycosyltransferase (TIGR04372 family)
MEHDCIRIGGRLFLVCQPEASGNGRPTGYGNFLRHVEQVVRASAGLGSGLYMVPPPAALNRAIYDLVSAEVRIVGQAEPLGWLLRVAWVVRSPFRYGAPMAWLHARAARRLRPPLHGLMLAARRRAWRRLDRTLDGWERSCRRVAASYGLRSSARWTTVFGEARTRIRAAGVRQAPRLQLRPQVAAATERLARRHGFDPARPTVTLHVREAGFRQRGAVRQQTVDAVRNGRIDTYTPAVRRLVAQGFQIVRIGDSSMTPYAEAGVIDVATAAWRTDALELWAMLQSRFFISSDSGPYFLALLCGVPTLAVNVVQVGYYTARRWDRYVCKTAVDQRTGTRVSLLEMLTPSFVQTALDPRRWAWEDTSANDIADAADEMVSLLGVKRPGRTGAQRRHDDALDRLTAEWRPEWRSPIGLVFRQRGAGTMSACFAEQILGNGGKVP